VTIEATVVCKLHNKVTEVSVIIIPYDTKEILASYCINSTHVRGCVVFSNTSIALLPQVTFSYRC
jgi:hypothetical protein